MRIRRPKLQLPHPLLLASFAMIWPLCAIVLTVQDVRPSTAEPLLSAVEAKTEQALRTVAAVPARMRQQWQSYLAES